MERKKKKNNTAFNSGSGRSMDWNERQVNCGLVSVSHQFRGGFLEKSKVLTVEDRAQTYFQRDKTCISCQVMMVDIAWQRAKWFFFLKVFVGMLLSCFQSVFQRELELLNSVDILSLYGAFGILLRVVGFESFPLRIFVLSNRRATDREPTSS